MGKHELLIIGGGTGGLRTAIIAAKSGYDTGLVEPGHLGGTCLNTGCIPTKTLLHAAHLYNEMKDFDDLGLKGKVTYDFAKVMGRMQKIVTQGWTHAVDSVKKMDNLTLYKGKAEFKTGNSVVVKGKEVKADKIIIATGASPWAPPIPGLKEAGYMTNEDALKLKKQPKTLLMIGGGYISCELASFFASFGTKVIILERMPKILAMLDDEISEFMRERLEELGIEIHLNMDTFEISGQNGKKVNIKTKILGDENSPVVVYSGDHLLVSTGRPPNTRELGLDKAGVEVSERGHVVVNDNFQSSNPNVYAMGDVHGKSPFAHTVKREAKIILEDALMNEKKSVRYDTIPWAAFTFPTIGGVGLSEKQAREKGFDVGIMRAEFSKVGKAKIIKHTKGFVKVVYDKKTRNLLGCVIVGPDAHNLIHEFVVLLNTPDPKVDYILQTVHIHPTLAEVMEELREVE